VQEAQVVVDLGGRRVSQKKIARRRLLVDRDRRREPVDVVDVGLLHHLQELARVGGERLDVAPLALGVDRVEGEARLAGPREAGDADEAIPRQPDGDVLQVVLAGPVDDGLVGSHARGPLYLANTCSQRTRRQRNAAVCVYPDMVAAHLPPRLTAARVERIALASVAADYEPQP